MKNNRIEKGKQVLKKLEENLLEKEIEDLIAREKAKRKILKKLAQPTYQNIEKTNN